MEIKASAVKELREATGAGMMDCKKALVECKGDFEKAKKLLREKGLAKAQQKQSRIAAEGLCAFAEKGNVGYLYELNSETDFVAQNDNFLKLIEEIGKLLIESKVTSTEDALKLKNKKGETIDELIAGLTAKIGEKITLRNVQRIEKDAKDFFFHYAHQGGKLVGLVVIDQKLPEVGRNLGMQVVASKPEYLTRKDVPKKVVDEEKEILLKQTIAEGKPENIAAKIVEGRINKFFEERCLLDQVYVRETELKVKQYLEKNKTNIKQYFLTEVGVGIEKRQDDFAAEVAAQMKK